MIDKIEMLLMTHLNLQDALITISNEIFESTANLNDERASALTHNRDRLIHILEEIQNQINTLLNSACGDNGNDNQYILNLAKAWADDLCKTLETIHAIDNELITLLEERKSKTTNEIASIFQSKQKFKGYNLNNVKK